jgi:hypothetical protein
MVGPEAFPSVLFRSRKLKIRARPVDDVNNLRHHGKCQRCFASTAIQIRRNALFTSPEYASDPYSFEYELLDTGIFDQNKYFDVLVTYAKNDIPRSITHTRRALPYVFSICWRKPRSVERSEVLPFTTS